MTQYVGLDVSLKMTALCVVDHDGAWLAEGKVASEPGALAAWLAVHAPEACRIGLETGPLSVWLWNELKERGLPVHVIDARHAKAGLALQTSKTDRNDARGLAQIMRTGWFREVRVKSKAAHLLRALLASRGMLVATRRDLENQIRGLLKTFGLVLGTARHGRFEVRLRDLLTAEPGLSRLIDPLLEARRAIIEQIEHYDRQLLTIARHHPAVARLMTVPGVGPVTAIAFAATIDDPTRFRRSRQIGAYLGLTPRRYQSGEVDRRGHISKAGDGLTRMLLFEAANALLTRRRKPCALKAWAEAIAARCGRKKAKVALARRLAVLLHRLWCDQTTFHPDIVQPVAA